MEKGQLTAQAIFDRVWNHFVIEDNPQSIKADGYSCLYRGPNGTMCAVGLWIPDNKYRSSMETKLIGRLLKEHDDLDFLKPFQTLLALLQHAHDSALNTDFKRSFTEFVYTLKDRFAVLGVVVPS